MDFSLNMNIWVSVLEFHGVRSLANVFCECVVSLEHLRY